MKKILSIAALALTGALMTSCGTDDDIIENAPQIANEQPVKKNNIVVVKTTVGLADNQTKALNIDYVNEVVEKTFAVDDQVAMRYMNTSDDYVKAVSEPLGVDDISADGKTATLTFTLVDPKDGEVELAYPASMVDDELAPLESLITAQNGTLANVAALDYSYSTATLTGDKVSDVTLNNRAAIVAYTLKNSDGTEDITSSVTKLTINDGELTFTVTRAAGAGPIYVALFGIYKDDIEYLATDGTKYYTKSVTNKSYASGTFFQQGLRMTEVPSAPDNAINGLFTISSTKLAYFAKGNLRYASSKWSFFGNQYDYNSTYNVNDWDKFGWVGSSGSLASATPGMWGVSNEPTTDYYGKNLDQLASDWGNVPDIGTGWRTLTSAEWEYLFVTRSASTVAGTTNARYAKAQVNGRHGVILFPDIYTHPAGVANPVGINNEGSTGWDGNSYSAADWAKMEEAGCVFLPAAGYRNPTSLDPDPIARCDEEGNYWSSTTTYEGWANVVSFRSEYLTVRVNDRYNGCSVRLIYSAN